MPKLVHSKNIVTNQIHGYRNPEIHNTKFNMPHELDLSKIIK